MICPEGKEFRSPFETVPTQAIQAVTFGKPGPFYASSQEQKQKIALSFVSRETDYVYHGDMVARANHDAVKYCSGLCWTVAALFGGPALKFGHASYIKNHYHGDTTTVWIMNDMKGGNAPTALRGFNLLKANRDQIGVYDNEADRSDGINIGFFIGRFPPYAGMGAGIEHGMGYSWSLWYNYARGSPPISSQRRNTNNDGSEGIFDSHAQRRNTSSNKMVWLV